MTLAGSPLTEQALVMSTPDSAGDLFVFPMSFAQQRLWILEELEPGSPAYNVPVARRLRGPLDLRALGTALAGVIARHEVLRTTFETQDGVPVQVVHPAPGRPVALPCTDLSALEPPAREAEVLRRATGEATRPFDLRRGPLLRVELLRTGPEEHVLLLTLHHIVTDGWSKGVLNRELAALYDAAVRQVEPALEPLPLQYADFAVWQRQWLEGEELERQVAFWRDALAAPRTTLDLPADRPRPPIATSNGALHDFELDAGIAQRARALGRAEGVTMFMTLLAAFQAVLHRYTGQDDIIVGSPIAGRTQAETEGLIGLFVNTLVLRTDLGGDPTFRTLLGRTRETALAAFAHEHLPFEKLVEVLQPERDRSRHPLFQVAFAVQNVPGGGAGFAGLESLPVATPRETAKFDVMMTVAESVGRMRASISYNSDIFDAGTIERMAGHFTVLLAGALDGPDTPISRLPLLTAPERALVTDAWNSTQRDFPEAREGSCLHELILAQCARTPGAVAVVPDDGAPPLTYGELAERTAALAAWLRRGGVGPGVLVGICADRSVDLVVALVGVMRAGGAYVPLDPEYPAQRLGFMLQDSAPAAILTRSHLLDRLDAARASAGEPGATAIATLCLDTEWEQVAAVAGATSGADPRVAATDPAYMIFTSGSTGRPKGALNSHAGIVNRLCWMQAEYGLTDADTVLQKTPASFDVSVWEFFWPLMTGARLALARPGGHRDPGYLADVVQRLSVSVLHFVPSMLQAFVASPEVVREGSRLGGTIRHLICSGEALSFELQEKTFALLGRRVGLHNLYGPTECAVDVTAWRCRPGDPARSVPIGAPIANTRVYVLDPFGAPVPIGVPGELYLGGVQVGLGYHRRDDLTAERFIPDPYRPAAGARLYRTGDRARWRADGVVEYLGRLDYQVKLRGLRIELGEIEATIRDADAVAEVVVVVREDAPGDQRLVAYCLAGPGGEADTAAIRARLAATLPEYMVPAAFVWLDAFPLTPSGKLDRKALPVPPADGPACGRAVTVPRHPLEFQLAQIWESLLGVSPIGIRDNFFELGGHSLLAVRMVSEIERACGRSVRLSYLFDAPTVEQLARKLLEDEAAEHPRGLVPVQPNGRETPIFFLHGDVRGGGLYCYRMAQALGPDQPLYALPPHRPEPGAPASIEAMADDYLAVIRSVQPMGPYRLGGFCNGALVAYELARRLRRAGDRVELLVLVDASAHGASLRHLEPVLDRLASRGAADVGARLDARVRLLEPLRAVEHQVRRIRQMSWARRRATIGRVSTRKARAALVALRLMKPAPATPSPWGPRVVPEPEYLFVQRASRAYLPRPYDGPLHVVRAWAGERDPRDPTRGWRHVAPLATAEVIRSSHLAIVTNDLPAIMRRLIASVQLRPPREAGA